MKKITVISALSVLLLISCSHSDGIEYSKLAAIDMGNLKKESAKFKAVFLFNNISADAYVVKQLVLDLKIDGKDIGTVFYKNAKEVRAHSEFSIAAEHVYETSLIVDPEEGPSDVYLIELSGDLTLKDKNGEEVTVPVKYKNSYAYKTDKDERKEERKQRKEDRKNNKITE